MKTHERKYFNLDRYTVNSITRNDVTDYTLVVSFGKTKLTLRYRATVDIRVFTPVVKIFIDDIHFHTAHVNDFDSMSFMSDFWEKLASVDHKYRSDQNDLKRAAIASIADKLFTE